MKKGNLIFLVFGFILLSRLCFLSISPAFFDGPEYLKLFESESLVEALQVAHLPIHPLFLFFGWLVNRFPLGSSLVKAEVLSGLVGFLSTIFVYLAAKVLVGKKKALVFILFAAFTPYFWLSQINVLYEPLLGLFLASSFYFLVRAVDKNGNGLWANSWWHLSAALFAAACLVSSTALVYLLFFSAFLVFQKGWRSAGNMVLYGFYLLPAALVYLAVFDLRGIALGQFFEALSAGNSLLAKLQAEGLYFFARGIRNSLLVYFNYLTFPIGLLLVLFFPLKEARKYFLLFAAWGLSLFLLNSFWHAGMFGRLSLFCSLPPLILISRVKSRALLFLAFAFLLFYSFRLVLPYSLKVVPYILEREYLAQLIEGGNQESLLLISNCETPYLGKGWENLVFNSPLFNEAETKLRIRQAVSSGKMVLMTSQAEMAPFFQYDGMGYHLLSKRKAHPQTAGEKLMAEFPNRVIKEWPNYRLKIYCLANCSLQKTLP